MKRCILWDVVRIEVRWLGAEGSVCIRKVGRDSPQRHEDTKETLAWASSPAADDDDETGSIGDSPVEVVGFVLLNLSDL